MWFFHLLNAQRGTECRPSLETINTSHKQNTHWFFNQKLKLLIITGYTDGSDLGICMLFQSLQGRPCGSPHPWGHFFEPDASLLERGCLRRSGFHRGSDRKGLEVGNGAQGVCLDWQRSVWLREKSHKRQLVM